MAKYEVKYACGHTETITLFEKMEERYKQIETLEKCGVCHECYKHKKMEVIANWEKHYGVCQLKGTDKQVAWAREIRYECFYEFPKLLEGSDQIIGIKFWGWVSKKDSSPYWINRNGWAIRNFAKEWKEETGVNVQEMEQ